MHARLDYAAAAPDPLKAMIGLERALAAASLAPALRELVKIRASQINGCAYCLEMHTREALAAGEDPTRLHVLAAWRESPLFSEQERAALAWTEQLTRLAEKGAPDAAFAPARAAFDDRALAELTFLIGAINLWNRLSVGFAVPHPARAGAVPARA
ncbi:alkylhydroperoxidase AhpD family core domain-containing protein [Albimonas donghaensis]|uniref:Alkylhydroperoxidase AhpD family core domain-containing protein n=1 Tax=Albimonas donghaensis TaxID=356660 RepID=A0A1H2XC88_9RHOB|nr:carboxymuconolactone decarboxylase family protein [Albimonas donghaensis]SDW90064.1 alkylhydroperoxidase AhpD family core domain-containing protein [Albimonas donghaensis]